MHINVAALNGGWIGFNSPTFSVDRTSFHSHIFIWILSGAVEVAAALCGHYDVAEVLLKLGADPKAHNRSRRFGSEHLFANALEAAATGGKKEIIQLMSNQGVDIRTPCLSYTNLRTAALTNGAERKAVIYLLGKGISPDLTSPHAENWATALQLSACYDYPRNDPQNSLVVLILRHGANPNLQFSYYSNVLRAAFQACNPRPVQLLMAAGADIHDASKSALEAAIFWIPPDRFRL